MKSWVLVAAIAGCVAAMGAGVYVLAKDNEPRPAKASASREQGSPRPPREPDDLEGRVADLEQDVADLRAALRSKRTFSPPAGSKRDSLDDWQADLDEVDGVADPALTDHVREVVAEEREREREERRDRREERRAERRNEVLDELAGKVSLTDGERDEIDGLWTGESETIASLIEEARSGERDFREVREEIQGLHTATDETVETLLDAEQYAAYLEVRPSGPGGRGGRPGGGGGPGGGGPGGGPPP